MIHHIHYATKDLVILLPPYCVGIGATMDLLMPHPSLDPNMILDPAPVLMPSIISAVLMTISVHMIVLIQLMKVVVDVNIILVVLSSHVFQEVYAWCIHIMYSVHAWPLYDYTMRSETCISTCMLYCNAHHHCELFDQFNKVLLQPMYYKIE